MTGTARPDFRPLPACPAGTQDLKLVSHIQNNRSPAQLAWQEAKFCSVAHVSACNALRSGWTSQPGRPRVGSRCLITNLSLVPGKLARGEIKCCLKIFSTDCGFSRTAEQHCHESMDSLRLGVAKSYSLPEFAKQINAEIPFVFYPQTLGQGQLSNCPGEG